MADKRESKRWNGQPAGVVKDTVELERSDVAGRRRQPSKR